MRAERIGPRDQTLQMNAPAYRVYSWAEGGGAMSRSFQEQTFLRHSLRWGADTAKPPA